MSVKIGKRCEIIVGYYSDRCGATRNPYGICWGPDNTGYIIVLDGEWNYDPDEQCWDGNDFRIKPGNIIWCEITRQNSRNLCVYHANIISNKTQ